MQLLQASNILFLYLFFDKTVPISGVVCVSLTLFGTQFEQILPTNSTQQENIEIEKLWP